MEGSPRGGSEGFEPPTTVIVPAYNEEKGIGRQVRSIRDVLQEAGIPHEVLVVDDGSTDATSDRAVEAGARLLEHAENRGYGAALKTGIWAASHETVVIIDGDGTYPASEIPALLRKLEQADMVVGARTGDEVRIPAVRRPAKRVLRWLAARISGERIPDLNSGLRAFRKECARQYFSILPDGFSFTSTITLAYFADNYRVVYHPIDYHARVGRSKLQPGHFMDFVVLVLRLAMLFQPLRVFVPLAAGVGGLGLLKVAFDVVALVPRHETLGLQLLYEAVLSSSALLLLLLAVQLLLVGMMADGLLRRIVQRNRDPVASHAVLAREAGTMREIRESPKKAASERDESMLDGKMAVDSPLSGTPNLDR